MKSSWGILFVIDSRSAVSYIAAAILVCTSNQLDMAFNFFSRRESTVL